MSKNKKEFKGVVYKATNNVNGLIYIGATTGSLNSRKRDHELKANRNVGSIFQNAVATFKPEAFKYEQIDTANSINELAEKEKKYIIKFNSKENGYNIDSGGGFQKKVYKYNFNGELIAEFDCLEDAAKTVNATKQGISRACLSVNHTLKGYIWCYVYPFVPIKDTRKKEVNQYSLEGKFITKYKSVSEASKHTNINKTCISKVCRKERVSAGGYFWGYN